MRALHVTGAPEMRTIEVLARTADIVMPTFLTMVVAGFPLDLTGIEQAGESADGRHDKFYGRGLTVPVDQL